jgi:hypothetical protein
MQIHVASVQAAHQMEGTFELLMPSLPPEQRQSDILGLLLADVN